MYTPLIEDHPEKQSRGKAVFTFASVLLFILVGVVSTRHLLNVNANNSLESMLAETPNLARKDVEQSAVANAPEPVPAPAGPSCKADNDEHWWCVHKCKEKADCSLVLTIDMGSGKTAPKLWAIRQKETEKKKIPEIHKAGTNSDFTGETGFVPICGIWSDVDQYQGDKKESHCTLAQGETYPPNCAKLTFEQWKQHFTTQMTCLLQKDLESGPDSTPTKQLKQYIVGVYGGITAGLRNDPHIITKFGAFQEGTTGGEEDTEAGELWAFLKTETGMSPHMRMLSGEEEGYYEWLGFNWGALREYDNGDTNKMQDAQDGLKNTFTIGGASAQIGIPTAQPMNTLDNTFYFHIGRDKYWVYANSIMWGGSLRLANMVKQYATSYFPSEEFYIKQLKKNKKTQVIERPAPSNFNAERTLPGGTTKKMIMDDFFNENNDLLCADICIHDNPDNGIKCNTAKEKRLYKGLCVMGFHFPTPTQWLTTEFVGTDYLKAKKTAAQPTGCLDGTTGDSVTLNFNTECDDPTYQDVPKPWWESRFPNVALPFYGRFFHRLINDAKDKQVPISPLPELSPGTEIAWGAVWAAMWIHGQFQGFPNLERNAAETTANEFRRNLGELKGEYTLGPLTIPAHFGTPEDKQ